MITRRTMMKRGAEAFAMASMPAFLQSKAESAQQIPIATAVTEVFGEGQKLVLVALEYTQPVRDSSLSPSKFQVQGRTISAVYASSTLDGPKVQQGRFVMLRLSPDDKNALLLTSPVGGGAGTRRSSGQDSGSPPPGEGGPGGQRAGGGPGGGPRSFPSPTLRPAEATVTQIGSLEGADGSLIPPPANPIVSTVTKNPIVDEFKQLTFEAPGGGKLAYNFFVPHGYDPKNRYPLVLFVHDAGTLSSNPMVTLAQGLGAIVWASPEDQVKRPCFVVAPQFATVAEGEKTGPGTTMDMVHGLLVSLAKQYSIDTRRLYSTGQSMGAMLSIAMNIAYPKFFAASYLVAGQWDAEQAAPLAKDKLWIVVSQGDERAYPGENAMTAVWEKAGAHISRAVWNGRADAAEFAKDVTAMKSRETPINYVALQKGTVVPASEEDTPISNHLNTWRIAYSIEGIRAWLFEQRLS